MNKYIRFILKEGYTEKAKIIFPFNTQFYNGKALVIFPSKQKVFISLEDENKKWEFI